MDDFSQAPLVQRLSIDLSEEQKKDFSNFVSEQRRYMNEDRQQWLDRQINYLDNYDNFTTYVRKNAPWRDASNINLPFTAIMVKSYHSRLYNIFSSEDVWNINGVETSDAEIAQGYQKLFRWYLNGYINEYRGIQGVIDEVAMDCATVGWSVVFKDWITKQQKIVEVVPNPDLMREIQDAQDQIDSGQKFSTAKYKEIQKVVTTFDGNRLRTIPYESILFPNYINESSNLNEPPLVWIDCPMSESELNLGVAQGIYDKDVVEKILLAGPSNPSENNEASYIKQKKSALSGINSNEITRPTKYAMGYAFANYDLDGDGIDESIMATMSEMGDIIRIQYLAKGRRPLYKFDCFSKPRQAYSRGIPEAVFSVQTQLNINYNMRNDYLALQTAPFGTYRSTSSLKNEPIEIQPGRFIPTDETTDLKVITFPASATVLQSEESLLWNYGQQTVSVSSISQGFMSGQVGPLRSTSGVNSLMNNLEKEFKPVVDRFARSFKTMLLDLLSDMGMLDNEVKARVVGPKFKHPEIFAQTDSILDHGRRFDLVLNVANLANSEEVRRNNAYMVYQTLAAPGLAAQFGIVTPKGIYNSLADWIQTYDYLEVDNYLQAPQGIDQALTLIQEIQFINQGVLPPMSMQDDHAAKAQGLLQFSQTPEYAQAKAAGLTVDNVDDIMTKAIQKHEELASMLAPKGLPNYTGDQGGEQNAVFANRSPQQGGMTNGTTSRDISNEGGGNQNQAGSAQAVQPA